MNIQTSVRAALLAGSMALAFAPHAHAERSGEPKEQQSEPKRLPADVTTDQTVATTGHVS